MLSHNMRYPSHSDVAPLHLTKLNKEVSEALANMENFKFW